jgi:hypothetical protein
VTLKIFATVGLTRITTHPTTGQILSATNLTILNYMLVHMGPMSERGLVLMMMSVQVSVAVLLGEDFAGKAEMGYCRQCVALPLLEFDMDLLG